ncbi:21516_t:CDS:1, partial [Rhizophagus irregularis]
HRTQSTTRKLNASEELLYIKNQWTNIPLSPSDRIPSKATKIQQGIFKKNLFIGTLIREARIKNKNNSISEIPLNYIILIDHILNKKANNYLPGDGKWIAFGQWL